VAVKKKTKDKDKDDKKVPSLKSSNTLGLGYTPRSVVDRTAKKRTGGADAIEAQQALSAVRTPELADRQPKPYISKEMEAFNKYKEKQKNKGGGSTALTEAQKLANKLAALKIQAEYDKADREAQKVLDDREATALEKAEATAERQRKFAALSEVANVYASQGAETDALYGGQLEDLPSRRQDDLDALLRAVSAGKETITGAENQFLSSLVAPQAYSDVPLVDFSTAQVGCAICTVG
jgi:hypothetical protein